MLTINRLVELLNPRRSDLQDPADVLRGHKMPGGTQDVCPKEAAAVEFSLDISRSKTRGAHAEGPQRMAVLLRLHTRKRADNIRGSRQPATLQLLRRQPTAKDVISSCVSHDVWRLAGPGDNAATGVSEPNSDLRRVFAVSGTAGLFLA